jgi:hypothetical protein
VVRCVFALALLYAAGSECVLAQDAARDAETIQKLIARVEALEREVAALKAGAPTTAPAQPAAAAVPPKQDLAPVPEAPPPEPEPEPRFTFHGYADVGFLRNEDGASDKRFNLGEVDLFATARISPRLNVLLETVIETDNQLAVASVPVNVERLLLQYRQNDYFNLDIGSYRTAIGYYNTLLRGSWLETALTRPKLFTFEDEGGFLPLHNVGLSANGKIPSGDLGLHYVFEVGSSRNYAQPGRTGLVFEQNGATNLALFARPHVVPGLQVGFSTYHDRFSPLPGANLSRSVWTAHAVYQAHRFEFLNEGVLARFNEGGLGNANIPGFYSQLAYRASSSLTPYFRYDYANLYGTGQVGEFAPQYVPWHTVISGGLRYDLSESVALKFELGRETDRTQAAFIRAALQIAFTF